MTTFIHAADIHLDSPLRGLARYEGAPVEAFRNATRRALENLVTLALDRRVELAVLAGDLYDGDWLDYNTGLFFANQMSRLRAAAIPVALVRGNHDARNAIARSLRLPENVHEFAADAPETWRLESLGVAVHGRSFATSATTENMAVSYPAAVPGLFNIGVLHTALTGREGHDSYAPCTLDELVAHGYEYWALGHVHARECIRGDAPAVHFPGNIQGRHIRETGPKGCLLVETGQGKAEVEFCALDVVRWEVVRIAGKDVATPDDVALRAREWLPGALEAAEGRPLAVRAIVEGPCPAHGALIAAEERIEADLRALANDVASDAVWVEKVRLETRPETVEELSLYEGPLEDLAEVTAECEQGGDIEMFKALFEELRRSLPKPLISGDGPLADLFVADAERIPLREARELIYRALTDSGATS